MRLLNLSRGMLAVPFGALILMLWGFGCAVDGEQPCRLAPGEWSFVVVPDTQIYSQDLPGFFLAQFDWIESVRESESVRFVLHEGDITNDNSSAHWGLAAQAFGSLASELPYIIVPGNHDYGTDGSANSRASLMSETFHPRWPWGDVIDAGLFENGRVENSYSVVEVSEAQRWLLIGLEFGPRDRVLQWARGVLESHPGLPTVIVTHAYLYSDGTRYDISTRDDQQWSPYSFDFAIGMSVNDGQQIWEKLIEDFDQIRFVFSGHVLNEGVAHLASERPSGAVTHQILANYQHQELGGGGFLRIVRINEAQGTARVCTYSPVLNEWKRDAANMFEVAW